MVLRCYTMLFPRHFFSTCNVPEKHRVQLHVYVRCYTRFIVNHAIFDLTRVWGAYSSFLLPIIYYMATGTTISVVTGLRVRKDLSLYCITTVLLLYDVALCANRPSSCNRRFYGTVRRHHTRVRYKTCERHYPMRFAHQPSSSFPKQVHRIILLLYSYFMTGADARSASAIVV